MEKILTIDFDIIMGPSLELYNNMIDGDRDILPIIENDIQLVKYANADLELYYKLTNFLLKMKKDKIKIIFIDSHEKVLNYISTPCILTNIDHHHDLGYNDIQWTDKKITCGNGVYKGIEQKKILKYIGLHSCMSMPVQQNIKFLESDIKKIDGNNFYTPSKIIICASYPGIPTNIRPLFNIGKSIFKEENIND